MSTDTPQPDTDRTVSLADDTPAVTTLPGIDRTDPVNGRMLPRKEFLKRYPPGTRVIAFTERNRKLGPFRITDAYTHMGHLDEDPEMVLKTVDDHGRAGALTKHRGRITANPRSYRYHENVTIARLPQDLSFDLSLAHVPGSINGWECIAAHDTYLAWAGKFTEPGLPNASGMGNRDVIELVRESDDCWRVRRGKRDERDWNTLNWAWAHRTFESRTDGINHLLDWFEKYPVSEDEAERAEDATAPTLEAQL